jgi:hypothetical protein
MTTPKVTKRLIEVRDEGLFSPFVGLSRALFLSPVDVTATRMRNLNLQPRTEDKQQQQTQASRGIIFCSDFMSA